MKNPRFEAILFDMVGVLVTPKKNYYPETVAQKHARQIEQLFNHLDDTKLIKNVKEKLHLNNQEIEAAARVISKRFEKYQPVWNLLPGLKNKYKLAVVNNGNAIALSYWKKDFDFSIFDLFVNSAVLGLKKPDPAIFKYVCDKLNVKPGRCIFMDDDPKNIESASQLGMTTILWSQTNIDSGYETLLKLLNVKSTIPLL